MFILIENENAYDFSFDYEAVANAVISQVLEMERCPYEVEVNIVLTSNEEICKTNREFRDIDRETDVLSFPMVDFTNPANYDILEDDFKSYYNPDSGELMLGDIMISIPKAQEQAVSYGHDSKREYAFLIAHSMLHLLGYDHMISEEARIMEEKQEKVLQELNIMR